jgi:hypothetical protein
MTLYYQCMWNGQPGECDTKLTTPVNADSCPATTFTTQIAASAAGSGSTYCGELNGLGNDGFHFQHRDYCCANDQPTQQWSNCVLTANIGPVPAGQDLSGVSQVVLSAKPELQVSHPMLLLSPHLKLTCILTY